MKRLGRGRVKTVYLIDEETVLKECGSPAALLGELAKLIMAHALGYPVALPLRILGTGFVQERLRMLPDDPEMGYWWYFDDPACKPGVEDLKAGNLGYNSEGVLVIHDCEIAGW